MRILFASFFVLNLAIFTGCDDGCKDGTCPVTSANCECMNCECTICKCE